MYPYYQPYQTSPYYPALQQQQQQTVQPPVQGPVDERIWVTGEAGAQAYLVAANGFVRLWDSTAPVFYEKQADATGRPFPLAVYDYKRRGGDPEAVTSDLSGRLAGLEERIAALEKKRPVKKEAEADD